MTYKHALKIVSELNNKRILLGHDDATEQIKQKQNKRRNQIMIVKR